MVSSHSIFFFHFFLFLLQGLLINGDVSLDPNGHISIRWDIVQWHDDIYDAKVSLFNYQLFRHIERPGWRLTWDWANDEVIWGMEGGETTEQGDCSKFRGGVLPHCCKRNPVVIDLLPGTPYNKQTFNCCKGGVLSTINQDPSKYGAMFQMHVGNAPMEGYMNHTMNNTEQSRLTSKLTPQNFSLGLPGYICDTPKLIKPTKFYEDNGRRSTQAFVTWNITCKYLQVRASKAPTCCVSFSAFYSKTITSCPKCSCGCRGQPGRTCVKDGVTPTWIKLPSSEEEVVPPALKCTHHMCPIQVHWHIKTSYRDYWRVKMTIHNLNYVKNYTQWTMAVEHPNLKSVVQVFSFNYKPLTQYGSVNESGMFWGIHFYNEMLLTSGKYGNVQTEMLLGKGPSFSFSGGFGFPRRISFNGDECVMPLPEEYPRLPKSRF